MAALLSTSNPNDRLTIREAESPQDIELARILFREYQVELGVDLCFQNFEQELANLPGRYAPPKGVILLAWEGDTPSGCVAVRPLADDICELKRLFIRPEARGFGLGRILTERAFAVARRAGYRSIRLDTLPTMGAAIVLYRNLGFRSIAPYTGNPVPGALFMEKTLDDGL